MFPDTPTATGHIIVTGPGFTRRVKVPPGRDGIVELAVVPYQKLISRTLLASYEPPHEKPGLEHVGVSHRKLSDTIAY